MQNLSSLLPDQINWKTTVLVICIALVLTLPYGATASTNVKNSSYNSSRWFVHFEASEENGFTGDIAHLHIRAGELREARDFVERSIRITFSANTQISDEISVSVGKVISSILGVTGAVTKNSNGSFDIFLISGTKGYFGVHKPVLFAGFVPDQFYKPPIPAEVVSLLSLPAANAVGNYFRSWPNPY